MNNVTCIVLLIAAMTGLTGCGAYTLQGKVIEGFDSGIVIVPATDPRLQEPGVREASLTIHRDPDSLARKVVATARADADGYFAVELGEFGTGWMDEYWLIESSRSGFRNAAETVRLPRNAGRNRLLIILAPGQATPSQYRDELWEEYRRYR